MEKFSFNLVDEPWIPVVENGRPRLMSLLDALSRAHEVDGLATANPLETIAVLRQVLLPAYLDACRIPDSEGEWKRRWREGRLPDEEIKGYLHHHRDRFDLFGARPFGQAAGLRTGKDEDKPVSLLIASIATGNNVPLFTSRTEAAPPALTPAEAARAMLATQCWDTAAIKSGAADDPQVKGGKTTGNPIGPCGALGVTVPIGRNLAETLILNSPIVRQPLPEDVPQWRRGQPVTGVWQQKGALGLLDLLTWQSRRVRLIPERDAGGRVVVRRVVLTAGDRLQPLPQDVEPHTAWRQVDKPRAGQAPVMPVRHRIGQDAWRGLASTLATIPEEKPVYTSPKLIIQLAGLDIELPLQVLVVGVEYGNQSAVVEDVIIDIIPLPLAALRPGEVRQVVESVIRQAEELRRAGNQLDDNLRRASGGSPIPWDKGLRVGDALMHDLDPVVRRLLAGLQQQPDRCGDGEDAWRTVARALALKAAEPALAAVPPTAFLGREEGRGGDGRKDNKPKKFYRASVAARWYSSAVDKILGIES
ncbi:type I-E CRISPR-associated protein Cse1/CasA [Micromonospora psammae]|uniref:type I-E CRISPR-associated protein Cse1/CasA n=1 Tax=Micromonospora sp. CPCC 205556 TaxID=3122398 RepID=UPI002FF0DCF6